MRLGSLLLAGLDGVAHAFFTREGGVSRGLYASLNGGLGSRDDRAAVEENRARMAAALAVAPQRLVSVHQIHSPLVVTVGEPWGTHARPKADALVTRKPGIALAVTTADCGPVLFADPQARVVGAAHAGWKGALGGVLEATLDAMEALGAERSRIVAALGPMISRDAYEVGPEFVERFAVHDPGNAAHFRPSDRAGHALFDLPAYIGRRLVTASVGAVDRLGRCTYADESLFFSFRRATHRGEPDYGRLISAIALDG